MATRTVLTYRDLEAMPEDTSRRYELYEGELVVTPSPNVPHQRAVGRLFMLLTEHVASRGLGEVLVSPIDCILSDRTVLVPDLVYVDAGRSSLITRRGIEGPPTLVVEILSPSTARRDRGRKLQLYASHRIPFYWILDPEARSLEAFALADNVLAPAGRLAGDETGALPPFSDLPIPVASLWA